MTRPALAFAGLGRIGARRLAAILDADNADIVGVFDVERDLADAAVETHGLPGRLAVSSYQHLTECGADALIISTPNFLHADQSLSALDSGHAVFCQKPLGCNAGEVERVLGRARDLDRLLAVDLTYRRSEALREIRRRAQRGEIGRIYAADLAFHNAFGPDRAWFYDRTKSGGGCFLDLGVHLVDMVQWVLGFPAVDNVSARFFAKGMPMRPREADGLEDHALARIDFANGAVAHLACSWHLSAGCNARIHATFHGTEGSLHLYNVNGAYFDLVAEKHVRTATETLSVPNGKWDSGNAVDFARRLTRTKRFEKEALRHVETARVMDQVYGA